MTMIGARLAELFGEAALEPERRKLRDQLDHEHGKGEAADRFGAIPAPGEIEKGQARDEAQDEAEEIGAAALGERGGVSILPDRIGHGGCGRGRGCAVRLAQAWRPFCCSPTRCLARGKGLGNPGNPGNRRRCIIGLRVAAGG
jgi:hypothetical protein